MSVRVLDQPPVNEQERADFRWLMDHLEELVAQYPDKWIAVSGGEVAAVAEGGAEAERLARLAKGADCRPVIHFVEGGAYVY